MTNERVIELLWEMIQNCERCEAGYVDPLRKEKAKALDIAMEAVKEKMERDKKCRNKLS
jgi:hypothetical protein